ETSIIDCEIIDTPENKVRKIMPLPTDQIIDLTTDDTDDSLIFIGSTSKIENNVECKKNNDSINNKIKFDTEKYELEMNNSALIRELCSEFPKTNDNDSNFHKNNSECKKNTVSSQNTVSSDIQFSQGIDELLDGDSDDDEENNSNSSTDEFSVCEKNNVSIGKKDSKTSTNNTKLNSQDIHFSEGIDDLLFDNWDEDEETNSNSLENDSACAKITSTNKIIKDNEKPEIAKKVLSTESSSGKITSQDSAVFTANSDDILFSEGFDDLWSDDYNNDDDFDISLDLTDYKRCKLIGINRKVKYAELTVSDPDSSKHAVVLLTEHWRDVLLELGEFVIIKARYSDIENKWVINNEYGMCVTQPDTLVSGTAVIHGSFCNRKGFLKHTYTGIDCLPNLEANDEALTCGSITHQLLQTALQEKIYDLDGIWKLLDRILKLPSTITLLYVSDLGIKQFKEMISEYIPKIHEFISYYIKGNKPEQWGDNFIGKIESVRDIEETVWLPKLGLKGKIDATVEVTVHKNRKIMPLEIKTGRSSFSTDHKGQVYLYVMMMQMLGHDVTSGLLLYIKENIMHEIQSTRHEQRDLLLLRNLMAYHLSRQPTIIDESNDLEMKKRIKWKLPGLPEPIYNVAACKRCSYNTICCVYATHDENLLLSNSHPYTKLQNQVLRDLTADHIDYVIHWISLIQMESIFEKNSEESQAICSRAPLERENLRTCLTYMIIDLPVIKKNDMFLHKFIRDPKEKGKFVFPVEDFRQVFSIDDYVMISTEIRLNIVSGSVVTITKDSISLLFEKDITQWNSMAYYHLDDFPSSTLPYRALGTVAAMLADNDITRRLRRIIIEREPATFTNKLPESVITGVGQNIMNQLNHYQQEALKAVITSTDFVLIKGMPGTGKTQTLVALIEMLSYLGHSVLITAHTHNAVDNVLLKLQDKKIDFLRLGSKTRVHPALHHKTDHYLLNECDTPDQLEAKYKKKNIVAVTCLGSHHALMSKRIFDYCVVDECTQAMQPFLLRPLYNATKFVLVGDPEQLPAVVRCSDARKLGMDEDLFTRLDTKNNTRMLKQQYRMNKPIMDLANRLTYKGKLLAGNDEIANTTLKFENPRVLNLCEEWIKQTLSSDLEHSVVMLNTRTTYNMHLTLNPINKSRDKDNELSRCSNYIEAAIVLRLLNVLIEAGINTDDIGVIAPYQAQLK
ncbi:hypothetical protein PV326_012052, partial [Microctonus aethiopoides]